MSLNKPIAFPSAWRSVLAQFRSRSPAGWALRCGLATGLVLAGWGVRQAVTSWVGPGLPTFITFYPAVMAAALLGGFGPGLLATVLSAVVVVCFVLPPGGEFHLTSPVDQVSLALFGIMGVFMSLIAELYRRHRKEAAAYERELALREVQREKEIFADLLDHADEAFAIGYPDGRLGRCNHAFEQLTGYSAADLRTLDWSATLTPPEWRELERQKLGLLNRTGQPVRYEKEYVRKDGSRVPIELLVHLARDAEGNPEFYYSFLTDITARKQAEEKLRASNAELTEFNRAMVDRELRMIELKQEINELCRQAGQPARYTVDGEEAVA